MAARMPKHWQILALLTIFVVAHMLRSPWRSAADSQKPLSIAFVGDSVTRYQYLSLVAYLKTGDWVDDDPIMWEKLHAGGWRNFYNYSHHFLSPYEACDCYRPDKLRPIRIYENRYYREGRHRVYYLQK